MATFMSNTNTDLVFYFYHILSVADVMSWVRTKHERQYVYCRLPWSLRSLCSNTASAPSDL